MGRCDIGDRHSAHGLHERQDCREGHAVQNGLPANGMPGKRSLIADRNTRYVVIVPLGTHYMLFGRMFRNGFLFEEKL
jgi:hypothetical protein